MVLSTQLEADISHIPTLGRKIDASRWRNTAVLTSHSLSADSTHTSIHTYTGSHPPLPAPLGYHTLNSDFCSASPGQAHTVKDVSIRTHSHMAVGLLQWILLQHYKPQRSFALCSWCPHTATSHRGHRSGWCKGEIVRGGQATGWLCECVCVCAEETLLDSASRQTCPSCQGNKYRPLSYYKFTHIHA